MIKTLYMLLLTCLIFSSGCAVPFTSNQVVSVNEVKEDIFEDLKPEDRDAISNLRKFPVTSSSHGNSASQPEITQTFSIKEFVKHYPQYVKKNSVNYTVGSHDLISITIYDEGDLTREGVRVSGEGQITFPLIGRLHVEGLSTSEIEDLISSKLAEGQYLLDAQVTVMVQFYESKKFSVLGAVRNPGVFPYKAQEKVLDAICAADGVDLEKGGNTAIITRTLPVSDNLQNAASMNDSLAESHKIAIYIDLEKLLKGDDQISNIPLLEADSIYIPEAEVYYILGEVNSPGSYKIDKQNLTLVETLGIAGGFTPIANRKKTRIIRVESGTEKVITVNIDAITRAGRKIQDVSIQPGDIIVVP